MYPDWLTETILSDVFEELGKLLTGHQGKQVANRMEGHCYSEVSLLIFLLRNQWKDCTLSYRALGLWPCPRKGAWGPNALRAPYVPLSRTFSKSGPG